MPPPAGGIAKAYFTPLMAPVPVATRLPQPGATQDTINGFLRIEAAGGPIMPDSVFFDIGIVLHSYAPNNQESMAEQVLALAIGWGNNASGTTIIHPSSGLPYFVSYSRCNSVGAKQQDSLVNMVKFVGKVTWRMQGQLVS